MHYPSGQYTTFGRSCLTFHLCDYNLDLNKLKALFACCSLKSIFNSTFSSIPVIEGTIR